MTHRVSDGRRGGRREDDRSREMLQGSDVVEGMRLGEVQSWGPLAVFPIFGNRNGADGGREDGSAGGRRGRSRSPRYITLREAIARGQAVITEVSEGGSVPELQVVNKGDARVLILDGEELAGAKQNRVLSTTILVDKHTNLVVPVSCTEQGRWAYVSPQFSESEVMAERRVRHSMRESTYAAMCVGGPARADQGRVWDEVDAVHSRQRTSSRTHALRDSYAEKKTDLDGMMAAFPLLDGQTGVLVLHGSRVVGLDCVSRAPQFAELHDKLLRSYAFEALVRGGAPGDRTVADLFLKRIGGLFGRRFKSPGLGWDVRFEGNGVLGSALTYRGTVVHAAFFDVGGVRGMADEADARDEHGVPRRERPGWRIADARERARRRSTG